MVSGLLLHVSRVAAAAAARTACFLSFGMTTVPLHRLRSTVGIDSGADVGMVGVALEVQLVRGAVSMLPLESCVLRPAVEVECASAHFNSSEAEMARQ